MRCMVCDKKTTWKNIDEYRYSKKDMHICTTCGFVSYPQRYKKPEEMRDYYRNDYRTPPTVESLLTGTKKIYYHESFLQDVLQKWGEAGKKNPVISDVGAAYGLFLNWWRHVKDGKTGQLLFPEIDLNGVELTQSFRRNAFHEFGLDLKEDFDDSKKYDLISSYKVAEHIFDVDKHLENYHKCLKDDGFLYISVPTWFKKLSNFGMEGFDIEYYYHPDHVNVWHEGHFKKILHRSGFKIIKSDHYMYDDTYLCQKIPAGESIPETEMFSYEQIMDLVKRTKEASDHVLNNKFDEAIDAFPNFPMAWRALYEYNKPKFHKEGWEWIEKNIAEKALSVDPEDCDYLMFAADLYMRYAKYDKAIELMQKGVRNRPKDATFFANIANSLRALVEKETDMKKKNSFITQARDVCRFIRDHHPGMLAQSVNWIYNDNASLPTKYEK